MNPRPQVSVIMPVYNDERFIGMAVNSILNQSFSEFELIIINDGSTDGTADVLNKVSDSRICVIHQDNQGVAKSLNLGFSLAKGEYIARMDSDDISRYDRLQLQVDFLNHNPEHSMVGSCCELVREDGSRLGHFLVPLTDAEIRKSIVWRNPFVHSSVMIRKSTLDKIGLYDESKMSLRAEDYELWWRVISISKVANLAENLVTRTHREASTCRVQESQHYQTKLNIQRRALKLGCAPPMIWIAIGLTMSNLLIERMLEHIRNYLGNKSNVH